jgi:aminomethyltransferase
MTQPKKTAFYDLHVKNGAKIVEFAGYLMPIQFRGIIEEHRRVRKTVGLFDITHMGEFELWGKDAEKFIQRMTTNDVSQIAMHQVQYSCMCYDHGGIVDDLLVYRLPEHFLLVVNGACLDKDFKWLSDHLEGEVILKNVSDETALLALQGPQTEAVMKKLTDKKLSDIKYYWSTWGKVNGVELLFSRTGYTGEDGFEIYFSAPVAERMWNALMNAGKEFNIEPIGLGARDSLRLEMKYMLYGNDIDQTTNPLEAGLGWIVKPAKGDFIGKGPILKLKEQGLKRKLVAFELLDKAFPRQHYEIQKNGKKIGEVTSGTFSPSLDKGIGLGYVPIENSELGTELDITIRGKQNKAVVVKAPFYKDFTHK